MGLVWNKKLFKSCQTISCFRSQLTAVRNDLTYSKPALAFKLKHVLGGNMQDFRLTSTCLARGWRCQGTYYAINSYRHSYHFLILNQSSTVLCSSRTPCTLEDVYSRTSQTEQFLSLHTRRVEYHKVSTYYSSPDSGSVFTIKSVYVLKPKNIHG